MSVTASERSYQGILAKIRDGSLEPGDKLITRTLADEFGVSLSPLREAINRLASEGLIAHIPGAGATVKKLTVDELDELYVLRDAVESCAAGIVAETITATDLELLKQLAEDQADIAKQIQASAKKVANKKQMADWLGIEERFHQAIIRCSRNRLLAKVNQDHRTLVQIFESQIKYTALLSKEVAQRTVAGKRKLLAAIQQRDASAARNLMSQQIQIGRQTVISFLRTQDVE